MNLIIAASLVAFLLYLLNRYLLSFWSRLGFKQFDPKFLVGDIGKMFLLKISMGEFFQEQYEKSKKHKSVGLYFSYRPALLVNDPVMIQDILVRDFTSFHDRPIHVDEEFDPLSGHLFGLAGQKWRDLRVKLSPTFTSGKLKGMFPIINDCGQVLEDYLVKEVTEGNNVMELRDIFSRYTITIISSVAFGIENDCINDPENIFRKMGNKIFETNWKQGIVDMLGILIPKVFDYIKVKSVEQEIEDFFLSVVKKTVDFREKNNFTRNDFMQMMIQLKDKGYVSVDKEETHQKAEGVTEFKKLTVNEVAAQVFIFFVAGFETSSSTMFYCMYELAKNLEVQQKAREEIHKALAGSASLTYESLSEMKYLQCCIDETLRKYPIAPMLTRKSTKDYKFAGSGLMIPKETSVFMPLLGLHRDPEIYENPLQFKPERFLNSPNGEGNSKGLFYLPFGDGPRNCIGMRLAKVTTKMGLALLLSKFKFEFEDKTIAEKEIIFHPNQLILTPRDDYKFKIKLV